MSERSSSVTKRQAQRSTSEENNKAREAARKATSKKKKASLWDKYSYHIVIGAFVFVVVVSVLSTLLGKKQTLSHTPVIELDEIDTHNAEEYGYKLGPNTFFEGWNLADAKKILSNHFSYRQQLMKCSGLEETTILEKNYDFRTEHPECTSPVTDQKNCSSSFAVASASAISDRYCLATKKNVRLSAQHFLSCQEEALGNECAGGSIASFLDFAKKKGIVDDQCFEYKGESNVACPDAILSKCERHYLLDYCVASSVEGIKREILKNGPVIGYIPIYRDFLVYKGGIYNVLEGTSKFQGGHAVKIVGWGNSDGTDYWIVENSWGESWGIKGYAHVAVGQESLYLDEYVFAVNPKYEQESPKAKEEANSTVYV